MASSGASVDESAVYCVSRCTVASCAGDVRIDKALSVSLGYWLQWSLRDVDTLFIGHHWELINAIVPVYDRFVHHGAYLNRTLREEFEVSCDSVLLIIVVDISAVYRV